MSAVISLRISDIREVLMTLLGHILKWAPEQAHLRVKAAYVCAVAVSVLVWVKSGLFFERCSRWVGRKGV